MKRENLPSIVNFIHKLNAAVRMGPGIASNPALHGLVLGPCSIEIAKNLDLAPDTVATTIGREYYLRGGDLSDEAALEQEIRSVMANVETNYPGTLFFKKMAHLYENLNLVDKMIDGSYQLVLFLPIEAPDLPSNISINTDSVNRYFRTPHNFSEPLFTEKYGNTINIEPVYTEPTNYKQLTSERVLANSDNIFTSFFTSALFYTEIYKYFLTKCLSPIYKTILDSPSVPDEIKEAIVYYRYKTIDVIDSYSKLILEDEDILNIMKNISENNEKQTNERLGAILQSKQEEIKLLLEERRLKHHDDNYLADQNAPDQDWDFINLTNHNEYAKVSKLWNKTNDLYRYNYAGRETQNNLITDLTQKMLKAFLYEGKSVTTEEILGIRALSLAHSVLNLLQTIGDKVGRDSLYDRRFVRGPAYRKRYYDDLVSLPPINPELLVEALAAGSLDTVELQKEINKVVAKCRLLQPKGKAAAAGADTRGPFYAFVDTIGGAYDTTGMGEPEHAKKLKKILQNAAKRVTAFAGTQEKTTPGETVAYAMRSFADDDTKLDAIYDIVDSAINECYDAVFGPAEASESED